MNKLNQIFKHVTQNLGETSYRSPWGILYIFGSKVGVLEHILLNLNQHYREREKPDTACVKPTAICRLAELAHCNVTHSVNTVLESPPRTII